MHDFEWVEGRPSLDEYFMRMSVLVSSRSTCLRRKVGAVVVKDKRVLTTGYNGAPRGIRHCSETGCMRAEAKVPSGTRHELCRGLHAEQNAIVQAAVFGTSLDGSSIYTTNFPCSLCVKLIINAGIREIIYDEDYNDELAKRLLKESGLKVRQYKLPK